MRRPALRIAALVGAAAATLALGLAAPAQAAKPGPRVPAGPYVALGDSFSAGSGVLPLSATANPLCAQSAVNYPHLIAQRTGRTLKDVTCGGADTGDFYTAQYPGTPAQLDAVTTDARLVTIGIGGNDSSLFTGLIQNCLTAGLSTLGQGSPCKDKYGSTYATTIRPRPTPRSRRPSPTRRPRRPRPPSSCPATRRCCRRRRVATSTMPIASGDVPYVNGIEQALNAAVKQAALDNGATFVDMWAPSAGRDACQLPWVRWVEPAIGSLKFVPIHPNAAGERAYADQIMANVGL